MKHLALRLTLILAALLIAVPVAGAAGNANPGVLPPDARVQGLTYGEWMAKWWQTMLAIPVGENPMVYPPTECFVERVGNVGLGNYFFATDGTFNCEMPAGVVLYQPIGSLEVSTLDPPPWHGDNEEQLLEILQQFPVSNVQASIDGVAVPNAGDYIVTSPYFPITVPEDNILGAPAGSGWSMASGAALMIAPLSPGQHTLHLHIEDQPMGYVYDWTFNITVTN